jgi:type IV pilus assembly protein PilC
MPLSQDVLNFTCDFSHMVENGHSLLHSLQYLAERQLNQDFFQIIEQIKQDVSEGHTMSGAMRKYPNVFSQDYTDVIREGKVNGTIDLALRQLCN